ncbi:MAG TPA: cytochrome C oxidase subunit IV family protein [Candidatus Acidoferrum sp.]|nr:cytochrome C oxidase subunit IV family protein [Candidatus Acidoferrum sp.]
MLSKKAYIGIWAALLGLLLATYLLANVRLGPFNNVIALAIAVTQMTLVALFFMHVRYEKALTWVFVCAGVIWLLIMFNFTLADYLTRPGPLHHIVNNRVGP